MSDGRNGTPEVVPSLPATDPVIPDLGAPAKPPMSPSELGVWAVPPETAALLRDIDNACAGVLQKLGSIEADYVAAKQQALDELRARRNLYKNLMDEAAKKAGLDIDKSRWNLDTRTMTLVRAS
jgi:hypothetical protein